MAFGRPGQRAGLDDDPAQACVGVDEAVARQREQQVMLAGARTDHDYVARTRGPLDLGQSGVRGEFEPAM